MKIKLFLFFILFALFIAIFTGCIPNSSGRSKAPDFTVDTLNISKIDQVNAKSYRSAKVSLADFKGKPLVLNFWAPWCPPCREEAPLLQQTYEKYKGKNIEFLMISIRDTDRNVINFMKDNNLTFPVGLDTEAVLTTRYSVSGIPTTFFIDRNGKIKRTYVGALQADQIDGFIGEII